MSPREPDRDIDRALASFARLRISVSVEARVMEAVRREAAVRRRREHAGARQRWLLAGAAILVLAADGAAWLRALARWTPTPAGLARATAHPLGLAHEVLRPCARLALLFAEVAAALGRAGQAVLHGLALAVPAPALAAAFVAGVLCLTFLAVRRDLRRSPAAARGLR